LKITSWELKTYQACEISLYKKFSMIIFLYKNNKNYSMYYSLLDSITKNNFLSSIYISKEFAEK